MAAIPPVILKASTRHTATLIFLHGLGDTGFGWAGALNTIRPKYMKVICPTANSIPVTCNMGMKMPAWYDILDIEEVGKKREDLEGVKHSSDNLDLLIRGEEEEVPRNRIIVGGFSQGGALALHNVLKNGSNPLGGCIALSSYLPGNFNPFVKGEGKIKTPLLQCHGDADEVVPINKGLEASKTISEFFNKCKFVKFENMGHESTQEELCLIQEFIGECTPDLPFTE